MVRYAGFWRRFWAMGIDIMVIFVIWTLPTTFTNLNPNHMTYRVLTYIAEGIYFVIFHSSKWQATPGKRLLRILVTDLDGGRIEFGRAVLRYFAMIPSGIIFGIGFMMAGFTKKKQAMHDKLAGTLVVRRPCS